VNKGNEERKKATPHTRGSTPDVNPSVGFHDGYPAYAGIDPFRAGIILCHIWLPRIRGDRPLFLTIPLLSVSATPHTRGSTLIIQYITPQKKGYPAYAGIDLLRLSADAPCTRLPRIRGDRPWLALMASSSDLATPHTRGSTFV